MSARNIELVHFAQQAARIRRALRAAEKAEAVERRQQQPAPRPADRPDGVLLFECYRYYRWLERAGQLQALADYLSNDHAGRWQRHKREGVDNVLRLLERPDRDWLVTPSRRGRIVDQLEFADRFDIHPVLLLAFLYEAGPYERIMKERERSEAPPWIQKYQRLSTLIRSQGGHSRTAK